MFNQFIKKPIEEPKPQPKAVPPASQNDPVLQQESKPKKEKVREEGLTDIENKVLSFIRNFPSVFPRTPWTIANWCEITENEAIKICEKLVADPKYKMRKVRHHHAEFALEIVE